MARVVNITFGSEKEREFLEGLKARVALMPNMTPMPVVEWKEGEPVCLAVVARLLLGAALNREDMEKKRELLPTIEAWVRQFEEVYKEGAVVAVPLAVVDVNGVPYVPIHHALDWGKRVLTREKARNRGW